MGGTFDWFGPESHPDFCGNPESSDYTADNHKSPATRTITPEQFQNRMVLRQAMMRHGFKPFDTDGGTSHLPMSPILTHTSPSP